MRKKAFTLVELLVVISIIALLIAMITPALKSAKDVVNLAYCQSTVNALNKSVFVYAENSRGFMMVYVHTLYPSHTGYPKAADSPWHSYQCFNSSGVDPNTGVMSDARNFGLVYSMKLLAPATMFYCPSPNASDARQSIDHYPTPWGTAMVSGESTLRCSYMWNPWVHTNPLSTGNFTYDDSLMLSRHDNARFLTSDLLDDWASMRHMTTVSNRWNMGFTDGHVYTYESGQYPTTSLYSFFMQQDDTICDCSQSWLDSVKGYNTKVRPLLPQ
ncbi:MAG: prepilin-type N-terminal cleavage/methylation domain-containing protein [Phycisphaerae bacterium]|jgi:prepilin-type N-terminal cleavage/methylation domain-containing protein